MIHGLAYCQVLQEVSTVQRLQWTLENEGLNFDDVFRTDECTVQLLLTINVY